MNLTEEQRSGVLVIHVGGPRLEAERAPAFKNEVAARIDEGHQRLVLDLSQVEFVDSSGLGAIVACLKRLSPEGILAIVGVKGTVGKLFALTRMDRVFPIYDTVDAAVEGMSH